MVKKGLIFGGILLFVVLMIVFGVFSQEKEETLPLERVTGVQRLPVVRIYEARREDLQLTLLFHGRIAPAAQVGVIPKIFGRVEEVYVEVGDTIHRGDPIIQLETEEIKLQVRQAQAALQGALANKARLTAGARVAEIEQAEAALKQAQANYNQAFLNYERSQRLFEEQVISARDWEAIQVQYEGAKAQLVNAQKTLYLIKEGPRAEDILSAEAAVAQAQVALEMAQLNERNATITAPISGSISRLQVEKGSMAGTGMAVATVVDIFSIKQNIQVTGRDIVSLQVGQKAQLRVDALPKETFTGSVKTISPAAEEGTGLFSVTILVENQDQILRPGMYGKVTIILEEGEDVLVVPLQALWIKEDRTSLFIVQDGMLKEVLVETGLKGDEKIEILSGIDVGDQVVVSRTSNLKEGMKVSVIPWSESH